MAFNGSGTFLINSSGQPVVTGTVISSTAFNAFTADVATGLSTCVTKDGQTATTARIVFALGISSTLVTDSTSITTGSIITAGGISAQKALWIGGLANIAGALTVQGALSVTGAITFTGALAISDATDSTSITTGSLKTAGGLGVVKALWVGGLTNIAGAVTHQSTTVLTGATTMSAALTYGGVALSNAVTGTGNMVLSASPTLTGTIAAAAATFSSTVGITGALTYGGVTLTAAVTGTGSMVLSAGPTLTGTLTAATATFSGVVTHSSTTTLSGALTYGGVALSNAVTGTGNMVLSAGPTLTGTQTNVANATTYSAGPFDYSTYKTQNTNSTVGNHAFIINYNAGGGGNVAFGAINDGQSVYPSNGGSFGVATYDGVGGAGTVKFRIFPTGGVGIGNTAATGSDPGAGVLKLTASMIYGGVTLSNSVTGTGSMVLSAGPTITNPVIVNITPGANHTWTQNSVVSMTSVESGAVANTLYLSAGKVAIGRTATTQTLTVENSTIYEGVLITGNNAPNVAFAAGAGGTVMAWKAGISGNVGTSFSISKGTTNDDKLVIDTNGAVKMTAYGAGAATFDASGNITSVSDMRDKILVGPYTWGLDEICKITPILHKWNAGSGMEQDHTYAGFSAQELREVLPHSTFEKPDNGKLSLWERAITAALVNAVKELSERIARLEGTA